MDSLTTRTTDQQRFEGQNNRLKVLAINASPHKGNGNTALILSPFLEGVKEAGADAEIVYTQDLTIRPCRGDIVCFCRKSGKCVQSDDMDYLVPKAKEADIIVFASPVYADGVTGPMKTLIDRLVPLVSIGIELHDGHTRHIPRDAKVRKIVLITNCGLWERDNFDPVIAHMKAISRNLNAIFAGALARPHGMFMKNAAELNLLAEAVIEAARQAGRQLVEIGRMENETLDAVSRDLVSREQYLEFTEKEVKTMCDRLGKEAAA